MVLVIALYCLAAAVFVVGLSLHAEFLEERRRKKRKAPAQVISIASARRPVGNLHKHA